jgi:superfamily II DNA or RNA helicase
VIKPRDYQIEALNALANGRRHGALRQLVALPTGSGKTIVAAYDLKRVVRATGKGAIFMAHRDELITQPAQKLPLVWDDVQIGRVKAESNQLGNQVTIASVQTIQHPKRLEQLVDAQPYSVLYIDEAHHATSDSYKRIINGLIEANPYLVVVGLTATPVRADGTRMSEVFTEITYQRTMIDLIEAGYLSDLELQQVALDVSLDGIPRTAGDLKPSEVRRVMLMPEIMNSMVEAWKTHAATRRTVAFAVDVEHAQQLAAVFVARGVKASVIYGDMPIEIRRKRLNDFQSGALEVLVNCQILVEGFDDIALHDAPPLSCIMLARPTLSQSLYIQQIGRGLRPSPDKESCLVLDFAYNSKRHHIVQLPHLFGMEELPKLVGGKKKNPLAELRHIPSIIAAVQEARKVDFRQPPPRAGFRWAKSQYGFALSMSGSFGFMLIRPVDEASTEFNVFHIEPPREDLDAKHEAAKTQEEFKLTSSNETQQGSKKKRMYKSEDYMEHRLTSKPMSFEWAFGLAEDACRELYETRSSGRKMTKSTILDREADWLAKPPTEQQVKALARVGKTPTNRGEATNMITCMIVERIVRDRTLATPKQLGYLRWKKIDFKKGITKGEATRLIARAKADEPKATAEAKPETPPPADVVEPPK